MGKPLSTPLFGVQIRYVIDSRIAITVSPVIGSILPTSASTDLPLSRKVMLRILRSVTAPQFVIANFLVAS